MKLLVLAAGYATRLYPSTLHTAKSLLPVAGRPMLEHVLDKFIGIPDLDAACIVINAKFAADFEDWATSYRKSHPDLKLKMINDGTTSEANRLGAIGDIQFVLDQEGLALKARPEGTTDDWVIVAGDNLFTQPMDRFLAIARKNAVSDRVTIATYDVGDLDQVRKKYNHIQTDQEGRVLSFLEKDPRATGTVTAICLYYFPHKTLAFLGRYLSENRGTTDQPGHYIQWLYSQKPSTLPNFGVYTCRLDGLWWDIGSRETYEEASRVLEQPTKPVEKKMNL